MAGKVSELILIQHSFVNLCFCPLFLFFPHPQTTGPRAKPEKEKEDEMESRTFRRFPQVPLCHIVTSLVLSIIHTVHTPRCTPTYLWMSGNSPAVVNYWRTKGRGRGGVDEWLDGSRRRSESEILD